MPLMYVTVLHGMSSFEYLCLNIAKIYFLILVKTLDHLKMPFKDAIPLLTVLVVGYILPVSEGTAACCKSVLITASEPVASKQATRLGKFNYYKMGANGWPVYTKDRKQYLYYTRFDAWIVGGKYKSGTG